MAIRCGDEWEVGTRVAGGSFGDVYIGHNAHSGQHAAIKLEKQRGTGSTSWSQEVKMYRCVTPHPGVPALLWSGMASDGRRGIALELLGPSLDDLFHALQRAISIPTLAASAVTLIDRIAWLHSRGIVHRDVKPQNFLCGRIALGEVEGRAKRPHVAFSARVDDIFVVDFGLAKAFNTRSGHVQFKRHQGRAGTARYASINTHKGHMQSRRDDLEAIGYMLVFLHKGRLPWQGVKASSRRHKHRKICAVKTNTPLDSLCEGMPSAFKTFIEYSRSLTFAQQPDYEYCKDLFSQVLREAPCTRPDWTNLDPESFACITALAASQRVGSVTSTGQSGTEPRNGCPGNNKGDTPKLAQAENNLSAGNAPATGGENGEAAALAGGSGVVAAAAGGAGGAPNGGASGGAAAHRSNAGGSSLPPGAARPAQSSVAPSGSGARMKSGASKRKADSCPTNRSFSPPRTRSRTAGPV